MNFHNWPPSRHNPQCKGFVATDLMHYFGLPPNAKWPAEGMPSQRIHGVWCWVNSVEQAKAMGQFHRARALCPACKENIPAGRLVQHFRSHADLCKHGVPPTDICMECQA